MAADVEKFRALSWDRVNLDAAPLFPQRVNPWRIEHLKVPDETDKAWLVTPTLRETNGLEIQWNYRTRAQGEDFFSNWTGWENGGFSFEITPEPYEIELDVRVKDFNATDHGDRPRWANINCTRFNYKTSTVSDCTGSTPEISPYSFVKLPRRIVLEDVYPNPVQSEATFTFGIPDSTRVRLLVYDALWREADRELVKVLGEGFHKVQWETSHIPAGTYFYHLIAGDHSLTKSLVFVK